ncbi:MAG: M30 family zinc metallopeptidase [Candidatus Sericytochromatia bacterium]
MKHPRHPLSLAIVAAVALAGCNGAAPNAAPTIAGQVPAPSGATPAGPAMAEGRIQLLDVQPGKPADFLTQAGKSLTIVASAASYSPGAPSFRLSVTGDTTATARAYGLASVSESAEMPFSHRYSASSRGLLADLEGPTPGLRRLANVGDRAIGSEEQFWVNTGDSRTTGDRQQTAVLARKSEHAYFNVDKQAKAISQAHLDRLVSEFEGKIYPRVTAAFGPEVKPGIDGEDRLFIVISPAVDNFGAEKGLMGYFWSRDAIPSSGEGSHSNQKEVLFMTDKLFDYPELTSFGTLAHEFQHLINFSQKAARTGYTVAEETWLDEGMSMYAMEVAGYGLPAGDKHIAKDLNEFQQKPAAYSLTDWSGNPHGFAYGQSYLFVRYMVDRFGPDVLKEILKADKSGQAGLDQVLASRQQSFANLFQAWTITNLVSDQPISEGTVYRYKNLPLTGDYGGFELKGFQTTPATSPEVTAALRPWGSAYYTFSSQEQQAWRFNLGDSGTTRLLGAAILP